jgi:hypothetical protein
MRGLDPDPTFHLDVDLDPTFHSDADSNPITHFSPDLDLPMLLQNAVPDPELPKLRIRRPQHLFYL